MIEEVPVDPVPVVPVDPVPVEPVDPVPVEPVLVEEVLLHPLAPG